MVTTTEFKEAEGIRKRRNGSSASPSLESQSISDGENDNAEKVVLQPNNALSKDKSFLEKLFSSKEEQNSFIPHLHKILGFSCLGSFAYRFAHLGRADGNFGPHSGTLFFILLHWLLNASAFIFVIPQRRIRDGGYRIWPEYRIHSLVFASRALAFMLLRWYEQTQGIPPNSSRCFWFMDILLVLATCAFADLGSYLQGKNHSNTIREATFSDPFEQWFASEMQLFLTAFCLVGYRRYTIHLLALSIIQINSFLMTLRRKNVASHFFLTGCYSLLLVAAFMIFSADDQYTRRTAVAGTFGCVATILRMGPLRVNKYMLWLGLGLLWTYIRITNKRAMFNSMFWIQALCVTKLISSGLGWYKRSKAPPEVPRSAVVGFLVFFSHFLLFAYLYYINS